MGDFLQFFDLNLLGATVRLATPLLFVALGALLCERSGVLNIGVEGIMLAGAFAAALGSILRPSAWVGVEAAMAAGAVCGLLIAWLAVTIKANQIVIGITFNVFSLGLTSFFYTVYFYRADASIVRTASFERWNIPGLSQLPGVGKILFQQEPLVYVALVLVVAVHGFLFWTAPGLAVRATGEYARAADTAGINVSRVRYLATIVGGVLVALGGAYLVLAEVRTFQPNMTAGRGFIGLAAVVFGTWHPLGAFLATLLFGSAEALQFRLQGTGWLSPSLMSTFPYVLTILALAGFVGRAQPPAEDGVPYIKA
jgi:simple sugar transport system permease protein